MPMLELSKAVPELSMPTKSGAQDTTTFTSFIFDAVNCLYALQFEADNTQLFLHLGQRHIPPPEDES